MKASSHPPGLYTHAALKLLEHEYSAAWAARDLDRCVELLGKVLAINPRSASALLSLGRIRGVRYEYDEAIEAFEKAVELSPRQQRMKVLVEAGKMSSDFLDPTIAEAFLTEAIGLAGKTEDAKLALAELSLRIRKREIAKVMVDEVLKSSPKNAHASLLWCRLHEDRPGDCEARLAGLLQSQQGELSVKAGYQLARVRDQAGDYDGAIQSLNHAKALLMNARNPIVEHRKKIRARFQELMEGFTVSKRSEWQTASSQFGEPRKIALLGGHPRSGTTLLEQVLDSHPGIISAEETENFNIFAYSPLMRSHTPLTGILEVMNACTPAELKAARQCYFEATDKGLEEAVGSRLLVDKNPSLTFLAPALFRVFPETRFVIMIRDPRDVIISCYMQSFFPVDAVSGNFLTLADTAAEVGSMMGIWSDLAQRLEGIVCEVRYENMVEDLESEARKVLDFLGLEWSDAVMNYDTHAREKIVRSPTAEAVTEKVHKRAMERWKNYQKHLEPVCDQLAPCLSALGYI